MVKLNNVDIVGFKVGILSTGRLDVTGGTIVAQERGVVLIGNEAGESEFDGTRIEAFISAIEVHASKAEREYISLLAGMNKEALNGALAEAAKAPQLERLNVLKQGKIGEFFKRQNIGDWVAPLALISSFLP